MASGLDISPGLVREELKKLNQVGLLESRKQGCQIHYRASIQYILFPELSFMVCKAMEMNQIINSIVTRLGNLDYATYDE